MRRVNLSGLACFEFCQFSRRCDLDCHADCQCLSLGLLEGRVPAFACLGSESGLLPIIRRACSKFHKFSSHGISDRAGPLPLAECWTTAGQWSRPPARPRNKFLCVFSVCNVSSLCFSLLNFVCYMITRLCSAAISLLPASGLPQGESVEQHFATIHFSRPMTRIGLHRVGLYRGTAVYIVYAALYPSKSGLI